MDIPFSYHLENNFNGSSGFNIEDGIHELIHNSLDANSNIINIEIIDDNYMFIIDDGEGNDEPKSFLRVESKKDDNKIGKRNTGFIGTVGSIKPNRVSILSLKKDDENIKSLTYDILGHNNEIKHEMKVGERKYKNVSTDPYLKSGYEGSFKKFFKEKKSKISEESAFIFEKIKDCEHSGTIVLFELDKEKTENIRSMFNDSQFKSKLLFSIKNINKVNFFDNKSLIEKPKYKDMLKNNNYAEIFGKYEVYINNEKRLIFKETIYTEKNCFFTNQFYIGDNGRIYPYKNKEENDYKGKFKAGFQLYKEEEWNSLDFVSTNDEKRNFIFEFDNGCRFTGSSKIESKISSRRNHGPYISIIYIENEDMGFFQEYFSLKNNKSTTSIDDANENIQKVLINRFRKNFIDYFSDYNSNKTFPDGISDWKPYKEVLQKIFGFAEKKQNRGEILREIKDLSYNGDADEEEQEEEDDEEDEDEEDDDEQEEKEENKSRETKRKSFKQVDVKNIKNNHGDRCFITKTLNTSLTPIQIDHKDGNRNNNTKENCNFLNINVHYIKTFNKPLYDLISSNKRNTSWFMFEHINTILDSPLLQLLFCEENVNFLLDDFKKAKNTLLKKNKDYEDFIQQCEKLSKK